MTRIRLRFVQRWVDRRHDAIRARYYFRRPGFKRMQLPGMPGSPEFMAAYTGAMNGETAKPIIVAAHRTTSGTINELVKRYKNSAAFVGLAPLTQSTYRNILDRFCDAHGEKLVATIAKQHVAAMYAEKYKTTPAAANHWLRLIKMVFALAVTEGMRDDDPAISVKRVRGKRQNVVEDGFHTWTEPEIEIFEDHYPHDTNARLAQTIMLYTAQRVSDARVVGRQHLLIHKKTGRRMIKVRQQKTGGWVAIPLHPKLAQALDAVPKGQLTFLLTGQGKPYSAKGLSQDMSRWCTLAGLPDCASHGLRKAACRRLAEAGCSEQQIAAISGHTDMRVLAEYVKMANKAHMAIDATDKLLALFGDGIPTMIDEADLDAETVVEGGSSLAAPATSIRNEKRTKLSTV